MKTVVLWGTGLVLVMLVLAAFYPPSFLMWAIIQLAGVVALLMLMRWAVKKMRDLQ